MLEPFNCSLMLASCPESFEFYRKNYEIPLFENKQTIKATDIGEQTAMVFPVDFLKKRAEGLIKRFRSHFLTQPEKIFRKPILL